MTGSQLLEAKSVSNPFFFPWLGEGVDMLNFVQMVALWAVVW